METSWGADYEAVLGFARKTGERERGCPNMHRGVFIRKKGGSVNRNFVPDPTAWSDSDDSERGNGYAAVLCRCPETRGRTGGAARTLKHRQRPTIARIRCRYGRPFGYQTVSDRDEIRQAALL